MYETHTPFTTAETMVLEVMTARNELGTPTWTFPSSLWIKPQLDTLKHRGLLEWKWDGDGNFEVSLTETGASQAKEGELLRRRPHFALAD